MIDAARVIDAELAILRTILHDSTNIARAERLDAEMFRDRLCGSIFDTMRELFKSDSSIDQVTIANKSEINKKALIRKFEDISRSAGISSSVSEYIEIIRDDFQRREISRAAQEIAAIASDEQLDIASIKSRSNDVLAAATIASNKKTLVKIDTALQAVWSSLEGTTESIQPVPTGLAAVDDQTGGGLHAGLLTVIAGRPSMGKSVLTANIAAHAAVEEDKKTLFVSLEDTALFLTKRILSRYSGVSYHKLIHNDVSSEWDALHRASSNLHKAPLWIDDGASQTIADVRATVAGLKLRHGLDLVVIDHLGEMGRDDDEYVSVSEVAKKARDIAKDYNIPVVLVSQLNRQLESRVDKRPMMSDLRGSGKIEEAARNIWFVYRHEYYNPGEMPGEMEIIIAKQTHGVTCRVSVETELETMTIRDWSIEHDCEKK